MGLRRPAAMIERSGQKQAKKPAFFEIKVNMGGAPAQVRRRAKIIKNGLKAAEFKAASPRPYRVFYRSGRFSPGRL